MHAITSFCNGAIADKRPSYNHAYKDINFLTCPCTFHDPEVPSLYELEAGFFKYGLSYIYKDRTILEVPAKAIQALRIIRAFITEKEEEAKKKIEADIANKLKQHKK